MSTPPQRPTSPPTMPTRTAPHAPTPRAKVPPFTPAPVQPSAFEKSGTSSGRTLKVCWQILVGLQAAGGAALLAIGALLYNSLNDLESTGFEDFEFLGVIVGSIFAFVGGLVLIWSLVMLYFASRNKVVAAIMGGTQALFWTVTDLGQIQSAGLGNIGFPTSLFFALGFLGLNASYRQWPGD